METPDSEDKPSPKKAPALSAFNISLMRKTLIGFFIIGFWFFLLVSVDLEWAEFHTFSQNTSSPLSFRVCRANKTIRYSERKRFLLRDSFPANKSNRLSSLAITAMLSSPGGNRSIEF